METRRDCKDTDIQKKIDHEVRMREGACKLLAACSQREQALEASKSLLVCNGRIMAYMSELQRLKEAQVMQRMSRRPSDAGPMDDRLPCKGRVSISDLRIPLMWKDTEYFKNKGELHRCAVFCLLQLGAQIHDTEMVMVDRTVTDICFESGVVFNDAGPDFELKVEIYSCGTEEDFSLSNTPKKLASKLSNSLGRSSGKRVRATLDGVGPVTNGGGNPLLLPAPTVAGPKYHLLAHTLLSLADVQDSFRTHDLTTTSSEESSFWLPLYGSMCCRLAAQPSCMCDQMMSGVLKMQQQAGVQHQWAPMFCVLRGCNLFCYRRQDEAEARVEPALTIAINKETRIRATDKDPKIKHQRMSITNRYGGDEVTHTLLAESRADMQRWMEAFWQHFYDMSQWKQCCDEVMKIEGPSPRKPPNMLSKQGSLYHEMAIDVADDIGAVTDILAKKMKEFELQRGLESPSWVSLYDCPVKPSACTAPLTSSSASIASDSDSAYSASPCMRRASPNIAATANGSAKDAGSGRNPKEQPWSRPRTLSLDAKLTSLKNRAMRAEAIPLKRGVVIPCSSSSSSGSTTPDSESASFSRPAAARQSLRKIRAKLDPRNWLQSQV